MTFWKEVLSTVIGGGLTSVIVVFSYAMLQWFLRATDVTVGYSWSWQGLNFYPSFDIRNRSGSRTYLLANIVYTKDSGTNLLFIDNKSLWGKELRPGSITQANGDFVRNVNSLSECLVTEVTVRLQNGRQFWLNGQGPGQLRMGRFQGLAFRLRQRIEKSAITLE